MSSARRVAAACSLGLSVVLVAQSLEAQESNPTRTDSAGRRLGRLDSLLQVRRATYDSAREAATPSVEWVVVQEQGLTLRAPAPIVEPVRQAMREVMSAAGVRGGAALEGRLARRLPSVRFDSSVARRFGSSVRLLADTGRPRVETVHRAIGRALQPADLAGPLAELVDGFALDGTDSALAVWTLSRRLPMRAPGAEEWTDAYVELATNEAQSLRQCRAGSAEACLTSLGLLGDAPATLATWYAPADFRHVVRAVGYGVISRQGTDGASLARRCLSDRDAEACAAAAALIPRERVPAPLGSDARRTFADEVFRSGGAGAYERLLGTPGTVRDRMAAAAGDSLESVAMRWRERVMQARPREAGVSPLLLVATVAWCGVFVGIATIRRSA